MRTTVTEIPQNSQIFLCDICKYITHNKKDFTKHINTTKHAKLTLANAEGDAIYPKNMYSCNSCNKKYDSRNGLWKHKKMCNITINESNENTIICDNESSDKHLIMMLVKQNSDLIKETNDFKNLILEIVKKDTYQSTTHNTNSHNKTFNLQFFLNETCKDAMNIMEFVDSIKLQLSDLENVGQVGYVEGISNIIVKNLKALDVNKRPVHCTDKKREVLYVKDENKWEKENDENKKIRKMIKYIASKNQRMLPKFKEAHPDCNKSVSRFSDKYNKILVESMGGSGDNDLEKEDKIIRNISKNIIVDK
jgi:hypothetical protein